MDEDPELQAIRMRRMKELQEQHGMSGGSSNPNALKEQEELSKRKEQREMMIAGLLEVDARKRLANIRLVKPQRAEAIEDIIINAAQRGQIRQKLTEEKLIELLEMISDQEQKKGETKIKIIRRPDFDDE